jgi:hypothetical protein
VLVGVIGLGVVGHADHLPHNLQARGKPETRLAGIDLRRAKLADVIKVHGQPTKVKAWEQDNPKIANSYDYYWNTRGVNLKVGVVRALNIEYVSFVEIEGPKSRNKNSRTGAGLSLGNTIRDIKRIYGARFKRRNIPKQKIKDVMIQWRQEEYSLVATLDSQNKITSLSLAAPE